ncbi:4-carboxymuconolactone decarboxylase [Malassezia caprae]|uniref:4-carboxymuconolactone decarboxylase n=1 Tax=Malassezia caprae TaxID=1381934 RepID=A0AAF0E7Q8_9BASI|nr:4-carboxymuconolactone decarboxylase [Malassezia caprae]
MPYRVEYASTGRATCKGPKPCSGTKIEKNELRLGSLTEIQGHTAMAWRHWGWYVTRADLSTTERVLANMRKEIEDVTQDLDGFEVLDAADQEKVLAAFALGHVRDEDKTPALIDNEEASASQNSHTTAPSRPGKRKSAPKEDKDQHDTTASDNKDEEDEPDRPDFLEDLPSKRTRKRTERFVMSSSTRQAKRKLSEDSEDVDDENEDEDEADEDEEEDEEDSDDSDVFHASDAGEDDDDEDDDD